MLAAGYRYRGSTLPLLDGAFVYGGWQFGKLFAAWPQPDGSWRGVPVADTPHLVSSIGEDETGELYVGSFQGVHRIVPTHTLPQIGVTSTLLYGAEGGRVRVDVALSSADLLHDVSFDFATSPGTAQAGEDYVAASGTLTFRPGEALLSLFIDLVDDDRDEEHVETFTVTITNHPHARTGAHTATVQIQDDDPPPIARVGDASAAEPAGAGSFCRFPVTLDVPSAFVIQVAFWADDGSAQAGLDYEVPFPSLLQILPGQTSAEIAIPLLPDALAEDNETFTLRLFSPPTYATLVTSVVTCTIVDDDALPVNGTEVAHGSSDDCRLHGRARHLPPALQSPRSSYEIVADAVSGDASPGLGLFRVSADNTTVVQSGTPVGTGTAVSLRWQNASNVAIGNQPFRAAQRTVWCRLRRG